MNIHLPLPDFIVQLSEMEVDFHPGNAITLSGTLPQLPGQQLALHARTFMGLSCPSREKNLDCFSLDLYAELALKNPYTTQFLNMYISALDVVGIEPDGLKNILDCYMIYLANQALGFASNQINHIVSTPQTVPNLYGVATVQVSPAAVANNPAVEDDQLKLFMNLVSFKLNEVIGPSGSSSPGSNLAPAISRSTRSRPGTGPSDLTVAISQATFSKIFGAMLNGGITLDIPAPPFPAPPPPHGWGLIGNTNSLFYAYYQVSASLQNGTISLQDDGKISIKDLVISWDTLKFEILLYDYLTNQAPPFEVPDPSYISLADPNTHRPANKIPIPIEYLGVSVNSSEMVLEGDIGP